MGHPGKKEKMVSGLLCFLVRNHSLLGVPVNVDLVIRENNTTKQYTYQIAYICETPSIEINPHY